MNINYTYLNLEYLDFFPLIYLHSDLLYYILSNPFIDINPNSFSPSLDNVNYPKYPVLSL